MAINNHLSIISLNVNGLNAPIKRHRVAEWIKRQKPSICCLQETHLRTTDTYRLKVAPIYRNDASLLNGNKQLAATASGGVGMSLDMTYFQDADGRSYYAETADVFLRHQTDGRLDAENERP